MRFEHIFCYAYSFIISVTPLPFYALGVIFFYFLGGLRPFTFCVYTVFSLGMLYLEHWQLAFDCVIIACSLESIRPGLVQGCKAPNGVG